MSLELLGTVYWAEGHPEQATQQPLEMPVSFQKTGKSVS